MKTEPIEADLLVQIDLDRLPQHIAIIMDGNGRWAKRRRLPRIAGHRAGISAVRQAVQACARLGVPYLTLYAFSVENWKRPHTEIKLLMGLLREYLKKEIGELNRQNIRLEVIGRIHELPKPVTQDLQNARDQTRQNTGLRLILALNYGGRTELVDAVRELLAHAKQNGSITVDESLLSDHLYTRGLPDPDLLIRTSGEFRLSNFLLWQVAYSELWVTETLWPDFTQKDLFQAIIDFQKRERRYGGLGLS
ncbi:MAG TPA: isoprenyl transferase [Terriglobia bacterium]|nr:isoprenyl transferase [Terriglobia bacterium]